MPFGPTHDLIKLLSTWSLNAYFQSIISTNSHQVPNDTPIIVASTHWNMIIDPALLSTQLTHGIKLHYWAKNTLFKNPIIRFILVDSGNIPVDRTTKNNQLLFKGTFDVLKLGEAVALFPEGTSYTEPRIMQIKDGIGWTALEYAKNLRSTGSELSGSTETAFGLKSLPKDTQPKDVNIVIVGLNYTSKTRYRSSVQLEYAEPIKISNEMITKFMSEDEGGAKSSVKELIAQLDLRLRSVTINSPDWETLWCAELVREMIWEDGHGPMEHYRDHMQRLIKIFSLPEEDLSETRTQLKSFKSKLISYHTLLQTHQTNHHILSKSIPIQSDDNLMITRFKVVFGFLFLRFPFFIIPGLFHLPIYFGSYLGSRLQPKEPESMSQNKLTLGLLFSILSIPIYIYQIYAFLLNSTTTTYTLVFKLVALSIGVSMILIIRKVHDLLIDEILIDLKSIKLLCFKLDEKSLNRLEALRQDCIKEFDEIFWNYDHEDEKSELKEFKELVQFRSKKSRLNSNYNLLNHKLKSN